MKYLHLITRILFNHFTEPVLSYKQFVCNIYFDFSSVHLWNAPVLLVKNKLKGQLEMLKRSIFNSAISELSNYQT